ncbi:uncharacterized protein LOC132558576 [Ylistrum balloti]|uniref:uncharacterized protein LOC132558576 n=1 Tax=Ylistrum balloti TaxID=509963 RepID=UPI002905B326|nr:uncharacterized protein LOC132558576 [Ylistrum balloti]
MADKFLAKWRADRTTYTDFEATMDAMKLDIQTRTAFKKLEGTLEYQKNGDMWTAVAKIGELPTRIFTYKLGQEIEAQGLDGFPLKTVSRLEGDTLIENSTSLETKVPVTITRRVEDNKMFCVRGKLFLCNIYLCETYKKSIYYLSFQGTNVES